MESCASQIPQEFEDRLRPANEPRVISLVLAPARLVLGALEDLNTLTRTIQSVDSKLDEVNEQFTGMRGEITEITDALNDRFDAVDRHLEPVSQITKRLAGWLPKERPERRLSGRAEQRQLPPAS